MKFRLPSLSAKFAARFSLPMEGRKYYVLLATLFLGSFFFSLIAFFPVNILKGSVERELSRSLETDVAIGSLALEFPCGLKARNVTTALSVPISYALRFDTLSLQPSLSDLMSGASVWNFSGSFNGGRFHGVADKDGNLSLHLRDIRLSVPVDAKNTFFIAGVIRQAHIDGCFPPGRGTETQWSLEADALELIGAQALGMKEDRLPFGHLRFEGKGKGPIMQVSQLVLDGGVVAADGQGTVTLKTPVEKSYLNLRVVLTPDPAAPKVASLLKLLNRPKEDGSHQIRLRGTLQRPALR